MKRYVRLIIQLPFIALALISCVLLYILLYPVAWLIFLWKWVWCMDNRKSAVNAMHELFVITFQGSLEMIKGQFHD
jgi:hypothetical protein